MKRIGKVIIIFGIILILCGVGLLAYSYISTRAGNIKAEKTVERIEALLPPESVGRVDEYNTLEMPSLEIDGKNIIALLEIPATGTTLPVEDEWDKDSLNSFPGRFIGSVYDGSLVVGGRDKKGCFDALKRIDTGSEITITDMTGTKYTYKVSEIQRKKSARGEDLSDEGAALTLFVRDEGTMDYIIVRCTQ